MKKCIYALLLIVGTLALTGLTVANGRLYWGLLYGSTVPALPNTFAANNSYTTGYYDGNGNPKTINNSTNTNALYNAHPDAYVNVLTTLLPDGYSVNTSYPGNTYFTDNGPNIYLPDGGMVYVHYANARKYDDEGNSIAHSLGYFTWTGKTLPTKATLPEIIIFPNTTGLSTWNTMRLGNGSFPSDTHIGFVLVPNGWNGVPSGTAKSPVKTALSVGDTTFYSLNSLNPETATGHLNQHALMFWDATPGLSLNGTGVDLGNLVFGMEDTRRDSGLSDDDFNDVLFTIDADPGAAIDIIDVPDLPDLEDTDTDDDGVLNPNDEYPNDPDRAFDIDGGKGTLAFEDLWPMKGDYDMNDLIVRYQVTRVEGLYEGVNKVKDLIITGRIQARGAGVGSGFGIELPGVNPYNVVTSGDYAAHLSVTDGKGVTTESDVSPEAPMIHANMTWILFENSHAVAQDVPGFKYFNTAAGQDDHIPAAVPQFRLEMTFATATEPGNAPYNPFIFSSTDRGKEVHLVNYPPTSLGSTALFGAEGTDDNSNVSAGRYYVSKTGLPWAMNIPENWTDHPLEDIAISKAYGDIAFWITSGGDLNPAWYESGIEGMIFHYGN